MEIPLQQILMSLYFFVFLPPNIFPISPINDKTDTKCIICSNRAHSFPTLSKVKALPSVLEIAVPKLPLFFLLTDPSLYLAFQGASDATRKDKWIMIIL